MGVDIWSLDFLLKFKNRKLGKTLMLGRQGFHIANDSGMAQDVLRSYDPSVQLREISGGPGYSETFFKYLGSTEVMSLDNSAYEGAEIVHDLNKPVPSHLAEAFDTIFDGGTLEHVYNFPLAIANVKVMLKTGGLFLMATVANNWLGHGFYQFSPELMWRLFSKKSGFEVELMQLVEVGEYPQPINAEDPEGTGKRGEIGVTSRPTYLMVAARKVGPPESNDVMQSDYVSVWAQS